MQSAVDYNKILQKAYNISMYYVKENDMAKDIAQATAIKYYLNVEKIEKKGSNAWIYKVSKNLSLNHLKKSKREFIYPNSYFEDKISIERSNQKKTLNIDDIDIFSIKEKNLLKQYYENPSNIDRPSCSISTMARNLFGLAIKVPLQSQGIFRSSCITEG